MEIVENFKHFALIGTGIIITAASFMVWKGPKDKTRSISAHAGIAKKRLYFLYAFLFLTSITLFYLFCIFWFIPTFNFPFGFSLLLNLMTIFLVLTALIPQAEKKIKAHKIFSYGFSIMMILFLFFIAISPHVSVFARIISGISAFWMVVAWYLTLYHKSHTRLHYLLYQYLYIISFCLSILAATYIRS